MANLQPSHTVILTKGVKNLVHRLALPEWSTQVGLHTALCRELAKLGESLAVAAEESGKGAERGTEHARALHTQLAAAFASGGACGGH